jgi:hypothetical protein
MADTTQAMSDYEPSINVFLVLHIDPGKMDDQITTFRATPVIYNRTHDEID